VGGAMQGDSVVYDELHFLALPSFADIADTFLRKRKVFFIEIDFKKTPLKKPSQNPQNPFFF
jgi:hypothetical protein